MKPALLLILLALAACQSHAGDKCSTGYIVYGAEPFCDGRDLVVCSAYGLRPGNDGTWLATTCKGPAGCRPQKDGPPACDVSANLDGDACSATDKELSACSAAAPGVLVKCDRDHIVTTACAHRCVPVNDYRAICD